MPSGATHEKLGLLTLGAGAIWLVGSAVAGLDHMPVRAAVVAGLGFGILLTPDIDLTTRTHEERRMLHIPIFGRMWIAFWASYSWWFEHRGLSHWPVVGTLTRLFWLCRPIFGMLAVLILFHYSSVIHVEVTQELGPLFRWWMFPFFVGWTLQDLVHETADVLVSEGKRKMRERGL